MTYQFEIARLGSLWEARELFCAIGLTHACAQARAGACARDLSSQKDIKLPSFYVLKYLALMIAPNKRPSPSQTSSLLQCGEFPHIEYRRDRGATPRHGSFPRQNQCGGQQPGRTLVNLSKNKVDAVDLVDRSVDARCL